MANPRITSFNDTTTAALRGMYAAMAVQASKNAMTAMVREDYDAANDHATQAEKWAMAAGAKAIGWVSLK